MTVTISTVMGSSDGKTSSEANEINIDVFSRGDDSILTIKYGGHYTIPMTTESAKALCYALFDISEGGFVADKKFIFKQGDKLLVDKNIRGYLFFEYDKAHLNKCSIRMGPTGTPIGQIDLNRLSIEKT